MLSPKDELKEVVAKGEHVLFLGAGASMEGGLPNWKDALLLLAGELAPVDEGRAAVMRADVAKNRLLEAADVFYGADLSESDRGECLRKVFGRACSVSGRLKQLASSSYRAVVTTNYDRLFSQAAVAAGVNLVSFTEQTDDLQEARVARERYIVRIHGRIEVPRTLVMGSASYSALSRRPEYASLIQTMFSDGTVVFFGFSFVDPFFVKTLEAIADATGGRARHKGYALLADEPAQELRVLLQRLNVAPVIYSAAHSHQEAWDLLCAAATVPVPDENISERRLRHNMAAVLAYLRTHEDEDLGSAVMEAAVLGVLADGPCESIEQMIDDTRQVLALPPQRTEMVRAAVGRLLRVGRIKRVANEYVVDPVADHESEPSEFARLAEGVTARAQARYGITLRAGCDYVQCVQEVLLRVLIADGMLLAHSFVSRRTRALGEVQELVEQAVARLEKADRVCMSELIAPIVNVLTRPERDEEEVLDRLSSAAFVMCATLTEPMLLGLADDLAKHQVLFDASVVLPWLCDGHPTRGVSSAIIDSVGRKAIPDVYVNELVAHRLLALKEVRAGALGERTRFERYARLYGLQHINAYLGGYAGSLASDATLTFERYLESVAPFTTEAQASDFLKSKGFEVASCRGDPAHVTLFRSALEERLLNSGRSRDSIRIGHDAKVLGFLTSQRVSPNPIFVTADRTLVAVLAESAYRQHVRHVFLPYQAVSLAQLMKGGAKYVRGLSRLVFSIRRNDVDQLRDFYMDRVLREYEPALLATAPEMVEAIVEEVERIGTRVGRLENLGDQDANERLRRFTALDQFEELFHQKMVAAKAKAGI